MSTTNARVLTRQPTVETSRVQFANDVAYYLSLRPRQLPSRYLYDELGSALFDAICQLPWYGLTRAETALLTKHAPEVFAALYPPHASWNSLGSGEKLARLSDGWPPPAVTARSASGGCFEAAPKRPRVR